MKIRTLISYLLVFLAGLAVSWLAKRPTTVVEEMQPIERTSQQRSAQSKNAVTKASSRNARADELLKKFSVASYNKEKKSAVMAEMETSELLLLIEAISQKAGITGLDYKDKEQLEDFLVEWSKRDSDAALAWADGIKNPRDRKALLGKVISHIAEKNWETGIELVLQYCRNEEGGWDIPYSISNKIVSTDADQMLRLTAQFVSSKGGTSGYSGEFPPNYDFRKALDGLAAIKSSLKQSESFSVLPTNLMEEWAKIDPDAAWQWLGEDKNVTFNDVDDFLEAYCETATNAQIIQILTQAGERSETPDQHFRSAWSVIAEKQNAELISQFLDAAPGNHQEKLNQFFRVSNRSRGGYFDVSKNMFVSQMSPAERMSVFAQDLDYSEMDRKFYTPILQRLGHSEAEIQRMLPTAK